MSALTIEDPGVLTTVQDMGRPGHAALGVARSGPADPLALVIANRLLANADDAAAIETTLTGATLLFDTDVHIALAGAQCEARIESDGGARTATMLRPLHLRAGERLVIGPATKGARTYCAVAGGVRTTPVMGSRSTHATTGLGSRCNRPLRAGDTLPIAPTPVPDPREHDRTALLDLIRAALFSRELRTVGELPETRCTLGRQSDRTGVRLEPDAPAGRREPIDSEAMHHGAIQATPDGALVALGPDAAPTGGYPVVASVILADLPNLGQRQPGDTLTLTPVTLEEARERFARQRHALDHAIPPAAPPA